MVNKIKKLFIILILGLSYSQSTFSQKMDHYNLSLRVTYLPMGGGKSEMYSKTKGKAEHTASESTQSNGSTKPELKKRKLKKDVRIEKTINGLDSLLRLTEFKFTVDNSIIDSVKAENGRNIYNNIPETDIDKFFSNGNTITIQLKEIKPNEMEQRVMDGNLFKFTLILKRAGMDTVRYEFGGNFAGGIMTNEIKNWLPVYLCYRQTKFFETMPMGKYFSNENLVSILIRFIEWKK
jgi:hypothetical protein